MDDARWMRRALELAETASGRTSPNPLVGAVVVRNGICVGEGFHPKAGEPHAEVFALREAGDAARGATLYVTLEPCSHYGRTPPCADLIVRCGIRRVVSAMEDPDPRVSGRGHERLRNAGIRVDAGLLESDARRLNAPYLKWKTTGVPFVTLKIAMSLDGKVATRTGESRWVTGDASRLDGHRLRNTHDAILVGVGTALADDPLLTTRLPDSSRDPTRVVLDTDARTPLTAKVVNVDSDAGTLLFVADDADDLRVNALAERGVEVCRVPRTPRGVDLNAVLKTLGERQVLSVLVEGGPTVHGSFAELRLVDRVVVYVAPVVIGGKDAPSAVGGMGFATLADSLHLESWRVSSVSPDVRLEADVKRL
jgi:diaminohydroxyphosphoribosylaminopyrimidine deaminase/5-amino-6-(5-phosphoribosylamino)uracil reductase